MRYNGDAPEDSVACGDWLIYVVLTLAAMVVLFISAEYQLVSQIKREAGSARGEKEEKRHDRPATVTPVERAGPPLLLAGLAVCFLVQGHAFLPSSDNCVQHVQRPWTLGARSIGGLKSLLFLGRVLLLGVVL